MASAPWDVVPPHDQLFVLVTGANSGIGLAIPKRMIREFLSSRPETGHLIIIVTTRSARKSAETIENLRITLENAAHTYPPAAATIARIHFLSVEMDLLNLRTVAAAADKLVNGTLTLGEGDEKRQVRIPRLDSIIFNAGLGGWTTVDWLRACWTILLSWKQSLTYPTFKLAEAGNVVDPLTGKTKQLSKEELAQLEAGGEEDDDLMGMVFCGNLFGHYLFAHRLIPLLRRKLNPRSSDPPLPPGRIIWESSIEACGKHFKPADFQGLRTLAPYESSKRLTDIIALTCHLPGVRPYSRSFFTVPSEDDSKDETIVQPRMYDVQPGLVCSGFFPCPSYLYWAYVMVMYIARWLGSPWHTNTSWNGAGAPVWVALEKDDVLEAEKAERAKWGSTADWFGNSDLMKRTEVEGWGWDGEIDGEIGKDEVGFLARSKGRKTGMKDATKESTEEFEALGAECWKELERLRVKWEKRLG